MGTLAKIFTNLSISRQVFNKTPFVAATNQQFVRNFIYNDKKKHKQGVGGKTQFRRVVHFPDSKIYTVKPLDNTHLAGRDPETGRVVAKGIGGGVKHKYHWIKYDRDGPSGEGEVQIEKVVRILKCGCRTADVALVAVGDEMKYILATENMKEGDLLKTSRFIPRIPVRAKEGDAYPLGALPVGTQIHNLEVHPGFNYHMIQAAGTFGTILRKFDDRVVVQLPTKKEKAFLQTCMATVGRLSNIEHGKTHIGSPQKLRELGNRPRSGWWQRKTGYHGRKIRRLPPMQIYKEPLPKEAPAVKFTYHC